MTLEEELALVLDADERARAYISKIPDRRVFPTPEAIASLSAFTEELPTIGRNASETIALLDNVGSPATVATNGGRYFGFVVGAAIPPAAAAERIMLAWNQGSPMAVTSPVSAAIEKVAARWLLDILDLPRLSAVGFGTSATSAGLSCLSAARLALLRRSGWDVDARGVFGAPQVRAVVSAQAHVAVKKALRIIGLGTDDIVVAPTDDQGRIDISRLPPLDSLTILCLQAGDVNTGEFDPFSELISVTRGTGAWVHVDGAFGLWARVADSVRHLTHGIEEADSWVVDGHKWLNTPYDSAMAICRNPEDLALAMNSDAVYATGSPEAQKNLTLDFSRRPRGIPVWAALRTLGRAGVSELVTRISHADGREVPPP
jgi:glutamate/tyrosine decarboxylase-like PLP-dependent enzyme